MKHAFGLLLLLSFIKSFGQHRDTANQHDFEALLKKGSSLTISRYDSEAGEEITLILRSEVQDCLHAKGIFLTLSNGELLAFDDADVMCRFNGDAMELSGAIVVTPEIYQKLSQFELTEYKLGIVLIVVEFQNEGESLKRLLEFSER